MSDILTRLLLNTGDYDKKLAKAKASSNDFAANIGGKAVAAVGKFATGIGIAMGGVEAFNKVIRSSQTLSDQFDNTMNALKGSVDAFFQSLATGNWDAFNGGLMQTIRNMRNVSSMQDMLADAKLTMGFDTKKFEREYVRLESIINDETKSKSEREGAYTQMEALVNGFKERVDKTASGAAETLVTQMNAKFGKNFTLQDLEKYITEVNNEFLNTETLQRLNRYKEELAKFEPGGSRAVDGGYVVTKEQYMQMNDELEKMRLLQDDNDESRKNMLAQLEYAVSLHRMADEFLKRSLEKQIKVAGLSKGGTNKKESPLVAGSLAALDEEIKNAQQEYANAASDAARQAALKTIEILQDKKATIEFYAKYEQPRYESQKTSLGKNATIPTSLPKIGLPIKKEDVKANDDYVESLNALANVMGAINGQTAEGIAGWLAWSASVMTASAQAVESIKKVVTAKTAEAAASAGASAASTPVVGWLMIGSAIMAALGAFAKIPKFAEGGIVGGSSYFGDKLLARVNSGEMILNQKQQARALSLIEGGNVRVSGDIRLNGKDIFISLRNYMAASGSKL